jgi:hypothetical protein
MFPEQPDCAAEFFIPALRSSVAMASEAIAHLLRQQRLGPAKVR